MASTLNPDHFPGAGSKPPSPKGHDTRSLGPGDSSDTGSDIAGPGLLDDDRIGLDRGTTQDVEGGRANAEDAGASLGDVHSDANSDRFGTGEHLTAGKDPAGPLYGDIGVDRIVARQEAGLSGGVEEAEAAGIGLEEEGDDETRGDARALEQLSDLSTGPDASDEDL